MDALSEKEEKLDTKEPKGIRPLFQLFSFLCPRLLIQPEALQKTKRTCLCHPKDHRTLFDSSVELLDPQQKGKWFIRSHVQLGERTAWVFNRPSPLSDFPPRQAENILIFLQD